MPSLFLNTVNLGLVRGLYHCIGRLSRANQYIQLCIKGGLGFEPVRKSPFYGGNAIALNECLQLGFKPVGIIESLLQIAGFGRVR